jgi:hypothetical protein
MGIPFDVAMSKYVVTDYHIELMQITNVHELANLSIKVTRVHLMTLIVSWNHMWLINLQLIFFILGLPKESLQTDLVSAYPLKGMAICPIICWY